MTDVRLKASIDWDHLDTTDSTGQLGSLINLARPLGFHVSAAARWRQLSWPVSDNYLGR
jgi:hypothetical protein